MIVPSNIHGHIFVVDLRRNGFIGNSLSTQAGLVFGDIGLRISTAMTGLCGALRIPYYLLPSILSSRLRDPFPERLRIGGFDNDARAEPWQVSAVLRRLCGLGQQCRHCHRQGDRRCGQGDVQLLRVMPAPIAYCRLCGTIKRISAVGLCANDL